IAVVDHGARWFGDSDSVMRENEYGRAALEPLEVRVQPFELGGIEVATIFEKHRTVQQDEMTAALVERLVELPRRPARLKSGRERFFAVRREPHVGASRRCIERNRKAGSGLLEFFIFLR